MTSLDETTATAILGLDTLWGGDVLDPSGAGRFIADSWFSDEPLPVAYTHPAAARLRQTGGVAGTEIDAGRGGRLPRRRWTCRAPSATWRRGAGPWAGCAGPTWRAWPAASASCGISPWSGWDGGRPSPMNAA